MAEGRGCVVGSGSFGVLPSGYITRLPYKISQSEAQYRLPIFQNMWIAITGEDDGTQNRTEPLRNSIPVLMAIFSLPVARRKFISKFIASESGRYCADLTDKVTHLVVCCPSDDEAAQSNKVKWAKDINAKRRREGLSPDGLIQIVWEEWLWDCQAWRGMSTALSFVIKLPTHHPHRS